MTRVLDVTVAELLGDVEMLGEDERLSVGGCSPSQLHKGAGAA